MGVTRDLPLHAAIAGGQTRATYATIAQSGSHVCERCESKAPTRGTALSDLSKAKYASVTTYKRDGTGVAAPVWIAGSGSAYTLTTISDA